MGHNLNPYESPQGGGIQKQPLPPTGWLWLSGFGCIAAGLVSILAGITGFVIYVVLRVLFSSP